MVSVISTPTINVNRYRCVHERRNPDPVPVPCPIPRTTVFWVRLAECTCGGRTLRTGARLPAGTHAETCPARPVCVTCTIVGNTWPDSEVGDVEVHPREALALVSTYDMPRILAACRARWALVKALLLGGAMLGSAERHDHATLFAQRDAVFAALCRMAQAEEAHRKASENLFTALRNVDPQGKSVTSAGSYALGWQDAGEEDNAAAGLRSYINILLEQVEVLP